MRRPSQRTMAVSSKAIILTGGLREEISQLEMKPGQLVSCINYQEEDGFTHGYTSVAGYERTDGTTLASSVEIAGEDDTDRENTRAGIEEVGTVATPAEGNVEGVVVYDGDIYAVRSNVGGTASNFYKATATGWEDVSSSVTISTGGSYEFAKGTFAKWPSGSEREEVLLIVNGIDPPMYFDGTSIEELTDVSGTLPNSPTSIAVFKRRVFLGFTTGQVYFSQNDEPDKWDIETGEGGVIECEKPITGFLVAPSDTIITTTSEKTFITKSFADAGVSVDAETQFLYKFYTEEYTNISGARASTAQRILDQLLFITERGLTSLEHTDTYGDFGESSMSKNVQSLLLSKLDRITCSTTKRSTNQYRVFFDDSTSLWFTFDIEKRVKGITQIIYDIPVTNISEENGLIAFTSEDGYVYLMDSGTSFDGEEILTKFQIPYHSYGTPSRWKRFHKVVLETTASSILDIKGKADFNYGSSFMPNTQTLDFTGEGDDGGIWNYDDWDSFLWGADASGVYAPSLYLTGVGNNMNFTITTESKFASQHTIHNAVIDYSTLERVA